MKEEGKIKEKGLSDLVVGLNWRDLRLVIVAGMVEGWWAGRKKQEEKWVDVPTRSLSRNWIFISRPDVPGSEDINLIKIIQYLDPVNTPDMLVIWKKGEKREGGG